MFTIKIAEITVGIRNRYDFVRKKCGNYIVEEEPLFTVEASEEELAREIAQSDDAVKGYPDLQGYSESVCIYRKICMKLPQYNAFLFHSAAVEYKGRAYLFSAPSGTGKTTHLKLWMKNYGDRLQIINGDKPVLRFAENGGFTVYGTPWSGKEGWQNNCSAPLGGICFLFRGETNRIGQITAAEAAPMAFKQILFPKEPVTLARMLSLVDDLLSAAPVYRMYCTISDEAAKLSFETLTGAQ